jgi:hypothetical protein
MKACLISVFGLFQCMCLWALTDVGLRVKKALIYVQSFVFFSSCQASGVTNFRRWPLGYLIH